MNKAYYVYILSNERYGTLYVGVTSDIVKRVWQHREGIIDGFTKKYNIKRLMWFETHEDVRAAITREKQIKKWNRSWKIELIQTGNPRWQDLYEVSSNRHSMDSRLLGNDTLGTNMIENRVKRILRGLRVGYSNRAPAPEARLLRSLQTQAAEARKLLA